MSDKSFELTHAESEKLLPAYLTGQLPVGTALAMASHVASCDVCRDNLQLAANHQTKSYRDSDVLMAGLQPERIESNFQRLWEAIETEPPRRQSWQRHYAVAVSICLIFFGLWVWQPFSDSPQGEYRTLSDPEPVSHAGQLRVVFHDSLTQVELQNLLQSASADVVSGPSARGVFTLQVTNLQEALAILRDREGVLFAERASY